MTQTSHELANFFVEASKALEELPHVKGKLNQTEEELAICRDVSQGKDARIDSLYSKQAELEARIEALKAERDAAEYAAMEAKETAEKLIASIRDVMKGAAAADAILNPTPVMESAPISPVGEPNEAGSVSSSAQPVLDSGSALAGPLQAGSDSSEAAPQEGSHTVIVSERPLDGVSSSHENTGDALGQSVSQETSASSSTSRPYDGEAYWLKPDSLSWADWVAGGGEKAPYAI